MFSIYIRNSNNCNFILASHQLRLRDNTNLKMSIFSLTDPAFEECKDCTVGCFFFEYPELHGKFIFLISLDLFESAELSLWNNSWSEIKNFSKNDMGWNFFNTQYDHEFLHLFNSVLEDDNITTSKFSMVPYSHGLSYQEHLLQNTYNVI